jgi:eukaryotic-like serine/threonine-protein kinase
VRALRTLGEVFVERGDQAAAQQAFDQAMAMLDDAGTDQPSSDVLVERGTVAYWLGMLDFRRNDLDAAEVQFKRYRTDATELTRRAPENSNWQLELSYALNNLGSVAKQQQQSERALELFGQSAELKDRVLALQPDNAALAVEQADSLSWIGSVLEQEGRLGEAMGYYQRQLELLRGIGERQPAADGWRHRLALAELLAGRLYLALGRLDDAEALYASAEASLEKLTLADPSNATWQRNLSFAQTHHAYLLLLNARPEAALARLLPAQLRMQPLLTRADAPSDWHRLDALTRLRLAQAEAALRRFDDAKIHLEQALHATGEIIEHNPDDNESRDMLARILIARGDLAATEGNPDAARVSWQQAHEALASVAPDSYNRHILQPWIVASTRLGNYAATSRERSRLEDGGYRLSFDAMP